MSVDAPPRRDRSLLLALALAPAIWAVFRYTALDATLIAPYYDASRHLFPLRNDRFLQTVMHSGLKMATIVAVGSVLAAYLASFCLPMLERHRLTLLRLIGGLIGGPLLVAYFKHRSALHCPWDIDIYGGFAPLRHFYDPTTAATAPGRCFPAGHASGGFAWMAFYFALRNARPRLANAALAGGLFLGWIMGWAQMVRGAHFLSHTVWSAWVVWTFLAVYYRIFAEPTKQGA